MIGAVVLSLINSVRRLLLPAYKGIIISKIALDSFSDIDRQALLQIFSEEHVQKKGNLSLLLEKLHYLTPEQRAEIFQKVDNDSQILPTLESTGSRFLQIASPSRKVSSNRQSVGERLASSGKLDMRF
jgi:hypothetical protein